MLNICLVASIFIDTGDHAQKSEAAKFLIVLKKLGLSSHRRDLPTGTETPDNAPNPNTRAQSFYFAIIFMYHLLKFGMF